MTYRNTRWIRLYEEWRGRLSGGSWRTDDKLPTLQELAAQFGISYLTAQKIIRKLADEGWVKIVHGKGIFASRPVPPAAGRLNGVGLMMQVCGDFFSEIYLNFQRELPPGCRIHACEQTEYMHDPTDRFRRRLLDFAEKVGGPLVVHGNHWFNFRVLNVCRPLPFQCNIVIHDFSREKLPEANRVLCDFEQGAYLAAEHLLSTGCEKLFFLTHERLPAAEYRRRGLDGDISDLMVKGILRACGNNDVEFSDAQVIRHNYTCFGNELLIRDLQEIMRCNRGRIGFIAISDNRAIPLYQAAEKTGREIGSDIGIVGCYNCRGCCSQLYPALTTLHFDESGIGRQLARLVVSGVRGETVIIPPRLIERASVNRDLVKVQGG